MGVGVGKYKINPQSSKIGRRKVKMKVIFFRRRHRVFLYVLEIDYKLDVYNREKTMEKILNKRFSLLSLSLCLFANHDQSTESFFYAFLSLLIKALAPCTHVS